MGRLDGFDDDFLSQLGADAKPDVAYLANHIGVLREEPNFLFFAESHFSETMSHFGRSGEDLYFYSSACANVA
jgi:hypothetical protein